jgi:hypothetical protein
MTSVIEAFLQILKEIAAGLASGTLIRTGSVWYARNLPANCALSLARLRTTLSRWMSF